MSNSYLYANDGGSIEVGCNCSFIHDVLFGEAFDKILLGNDVIIGPNVVLRASDH